MIDVRSFTGVWRIRERLNVMCVFVMAAYRINAYSLANTLFMHHYPMIAESLAMLNRSVRVAQGGAPTDPPPYAVLAKTKGALLPIAHGGADGTISVRELIPLRYGDVTAARLQSLLSSGAYIVMEQPRGYPYSIWIRDGNFRLPTGGIIWIGDYLFWNRNGLIYRMF